MYDSKNRFKSNIETKIFSLTQENSLIIILIRNLVTLFYSRQNKANEGCIIDNDDGNIIYDQYECYHHQQQREISPGIIFELNLICLSLAYAIVIAIVILLFFITTRIDDIIILYCQKTVFQTKKNITFFPFHHHIEWREFKKNHHKK